MSKITFEPNASGTGVFTIASPNSSTDYTMNLPEINGGTLVSTDASGNVGIGTNTPSRPLEIDSGGTSTVARLTSQGDYAEIYSDTNGVMILDADAGNTGAAPNFRVRVSGTERMRIDNSGNLLVGTTSLIGAGRVCIAVTGNTVRGIEIQNTNTTNVNALVFRNSSATIVGTITNSTTSTSYATSSDYRLKENVVTLDNAADRLKQIPVHRFNFIADPDATVDGFLAHEVQAIVPEAITGTKDEVDEEGNPVYQGIDQSKLVPLLVATVKELEARIAALEAN